MALNNSANLKYIDTGGGSYNLSVGTLAGNVTMSGTGNTLVGDIAGTALTSAVSVSAFGTNSGAHLTSGGQNSCFGQQSLFTETTGVGNAAFGGNAAALQNGVGGTTAIGFNALAVNTVGVHNVAVGANALANETGSGGGNLNTAVGYQAMLNANGTDGTTAIGYNAGSAQALYTDCVFVGTGADASVNNLENAIAIGENATVAASNAIVLGNSLHTTCTIWGIHGSTSTSGIAVLVNASGVMGTTTSSERFKNNIVDMGDKSSRLWDLRPVNFTYKNDPANTMQWGLIAEEVQKVIPEIVNLDEEGKPFTVRYLDLPLIMLNEMIKMKKEIEALKAQACR